jgi:hypothetical protein
MNLKNDNSGFTIIELITSFSLAMVVLVFLFNIVVILKETYIDTSVKSELIINQSLLSTSLNEDLYNGATSFKKVSCDSEYICYNVGFSDSSIKRLSISIKNKKVKYGDIEFSDDSFENLTYSVCATEYNTDYSVDSTLNVKVSFTSSVIEDQIFGFNVVYLYDADNFEVTGVNEC